MPKNTPLGQLISLWEIYENDPGLPVRWAMYLEKNPELPKQTSLIHTDSFLSAAFPLLAALRPYGYDSFLLTYAVYRHDLPEWLRGIDVPGPQKTEKDDLLEYRAFCEKIHYLPKDFYDFEEKAYLLQYARRCPEIFPARAKEVMLRLRYTNPLDVSLFPALESWEYAFYGYHVHKKFNFPVILVHVLRSELHKLRKAAAVMPGFRQVIFTPEYEKWALEFLEEHSQIPSQNMYFSDLPVG